MNTAIGLGWVDEAITGGSRSWTRTWTVDGQEGEGG